MNSKSSGDTGIIDVGPELAVIEPKEGESPETRTDRIRRLNRERQRRRRMKLKMSRHDDPTMAPDASNVNMNLDNLEGFDNADLDHTDQSGINVKSEQEFVEVHLQKSRNPRPRISRRKQPSKHVPASGENASESTSESANNAITAACHGQLTTGASNEPSQDTSEQIAVLVVASEIEVFGENPNVSNGGGQANESLEAEENDETMADTSKDESEGRSPRRKRNSTNTSDDEMTVTVRREKQRELKRKQKERMTPDQVEALRARYREWRRRRKEVMTPEQLEIIRRGNRERQRRRRERLGVRKRLASNQFRGASDAVIQGIKNLQAQGNLGEMVSSVGESPKGSVSDLMNATGLATIDDKTASNTSLAPSMGIPITSVASDLPTMVSTSHHALNVAQNTTGNAQANSLPAMTTAITSQPMTSRIVPCGTNLGIQGMPPGAFFPGMPMPGMQGAIFPGFQVPVTAGQAGGITVSGNPGTMVTTIPVSGMPAMQSQSSFFTGIPVTSTAANSLGFQPGSTQNSVHIAKEGQVLHNFQTLLPITPLQGMQGGQGMTFFTQLPLTGAGQLQAFPDPKYTTANQGNSGLFPQGVQIVQVPMQTEVQAETQKAVAQPQEAESLKPRSRGRARKRNTSAAEMLASLSNYAPPTSTPMASMLSALASSARDRLCLGNQVADDANTSGEKSLTVVQSEGNAPVLIQVPHNQPQSYPVYMGQQGDPFPGRTMASTIAGTLTVSASSGSLAGGESPSSIPHMNTFLTTMGAENQSAPDGNTTEKTPGEEMLKAENLDSDKISVAVATDNIQKETKGTNTGGTSDEAMSIGTMTDSLLRSSVATNTDKHNAASSEDVPKAIAAEEEEKSSAAAVIEGTD
ncbi:uncharacterized protein LOC5514633 [Nematostella vectensis]|uniref:uncharacterized protein LOC5514633 n=1 Tax=Nematostella vectensis TaxID=45351 RepID=UPI0020776E58|nr:uncharacterized protein LOC5514633 [Nematostella vectensis]